jgi:VIT1/CCC1 family predicted Fe2+/Mn2+ transporter
MRHDEIHRAHRIGWLRAAVLGANDGIVSTASLVLGVTAAEISRSGVLTAGVAGLVAGSMSMAAGEFVSVSSQKDAEDADLAKERAELEEDPETEHEELTGLYEARGVDRETSLRVAAQLMAHDALDAHARDELGIFGGASARPVEAAFASAGTFAVGAALPLIVVSIAPISLAIPAVGGVSLIALATLGATSARAGGANPVVAAARVTFWGALAMLMTSVVGGLFGSAM